LEVVVAYLNMSQYSFISCPCAFPFNRAPPHEGVLGEWRYSCTHYLTSALDGGKEPPVPIGYEAGWVPKPVWTRQGRDNSQPLSGLEPPTIQFVAQRYTAELSWPLRSIH
jgi:hypothetical protein